MLFSVGIDSTDDFADASSTQLFCSVVSGPAVLDFHCLMLFVEFVIFSSTDICSLHLLVRRLLSVTQVDIGYCFHVRDSL